MIPSLSPSSGSNSSSVLLARLFGSGDDIAEDGEPSRDRSSFSVSLGSGSRRGEERDRTEGRGPSLEAVLVGQGGTRRPRGVPDCEMSLCDMHGSRGAGDVRHRRHATGGRGRRAVIRGTAPPPRAAGRLCLPEWMPGLVGNAMGHKINKTTCKVMKGRLKWLPPPRSRRDRGTENIFQIFKIRFYFYYCYLNYH